MREPGDGTRPTVVLHVGPSPDSRGGIARTIALYSVSRLAESYDLRVVPSTVDGSFIRRLWVFGRGLTRVAVTLVGNPNALVHLHVASRGSFVRKRMFAVVARLFGGSYVAHIHGASFHEYVASGSPARRRAVRDFLERASMVIVLSHAWVGRVSAMGTLGNVRIVPNAVVPPSDADIAAARAEAPNESERPRVLFVGHLAPYKGIETLSSALVLLGERGVEMDMVVVGAGDSVGLEAAAEKAPGVIRLELLGWLDAPEVERQLGRADAFVLPSYAEGVPLALLEAMAWALPPVVTPVGGIPDVVTDGVTAVIVPPRDRHALAEAIERVLGDSDLRGRVGRAAREYVCSTHDLEVVCEHVAEAYDELGVVPRSGSGGSR